MKTIVRLVVCVWLIANSPEVQGASGCNYPTSLDSYSNKVTGDFLTTADINSRSCAIEQLELAQRQLLVIGKSGGNTIFGGSGANETLILRSTAHATKGQLLVDAAQLTVFSQTLVGARLVLDHQQGNNDIAQIGFLTRDSTANVMTASYIQAWYLDSTRSTQDSEIQFCVQNNANAVGCNTIAKLSSLGVWTDASSGSIKDYEGDIGALDKLKQLTTIGVYRAKGLPQDKIEKAERHYSPTAEDFYQIFGFGTDTTIAPKDAAWIAAKAVLELEARVAALEKVAP